MKKITVLFLTMLFLTSCYVQSRVTTIPVYDDIYYPYGWYYRYNGNVTTFYHAPSYMYRPYVVLKPKKEKQPTPRVVQPRRETNTSSPRVVQPRRETNTSSPRVVQPRRETNITPQRETNSKPINQTEQRFETRSNSGRR